MIWLTIGSGTGDERLLPPMNENWPVITSIPTPITVNGSTWKVLVEGIARDDGTWAGRLAFVNGTTIRTTDQETSQANRDALVYWASGLEQVYLEGALSRAR